MKTLAPKAWTVSTNSFQPATWAGLLSGVACGIPGITAPDTGEVTIMLTPFRARSA